MCAKAEFLYNLIRAGRSALFEIFADIVGLVV